MIASSKDEHSHHLSNRLAYHLLERKSGTATARRSCLSTFRAQLARLRAEPRRIFHASIAANPRLSHSARAIHHKIGTADRARRYCAPVAVETDWIAAHRPPRDERIEVVGCLRAAAVWIAYLRP